MPSLAAIIPAMSRPDIIYMSCAWSRRSRYARLRLLFQCLGLYIPPCKQQQSISLLLALYNPRSVRPTVFGHIARRGTSIRGKYRKPVVRRAQLFKFTALLCKVDTLKEVLHSTERVHKIPDITRPSAFELIVSNGFHQALLGIKECIHNPVSKGMVRHETFVGEKHSVFVCCLAQKMTRLWSLSRSKSM